VAYYRHTELVALLAAVGLAVDRVHERTPAETGSRTPAVHLTAHPTR
jgi:hypothetical protein